MPPAAGGVLTLQMLTALDDGNGADPAFLAKASQALMLDRAKSIKPNGDPILPADQLIDEQHVAAALSAGAGGAAPAPENPSAASVVAVDSDGLGVACAFTMNAPFGAARMAPGTGIVLAPAPDDQGNGFSALSPLILANKKNGNLYYLSAASGGAPAAIAQALVLDGVARGKLNLDQAMQRTRVFADGSGAAYVEDVAGGSGGVSGSGGALAALQAAGHQAQNSGPLGRVNAIFCPSDTPHHPDTCQLRTDYRGAGLSSALSSD
jgi:gamma-glutamyltranspeptidase/glutathione hydrolase